MAEPGNRLDRLRALDGEAFAAVVEDLARSAWGGEEWEVETSPLSPDRGVDVRLTRSGGTRLVHARQYEPSNALSVREVREFASLADDGRERVALATTGPVDEDARTVAADRGVELLAGDELAEAIDDHGVSVPSPAGERDLRAVVADLSAYLPEELADAAADAAVLVDRLGSFDRRIDRADRSADLVFVADGDVARIRFSEAGLLVYVRADDGWERALARSARAPEHAPRDAEERLRAAVEEALDR